MDDVKKQPQGAVEPASTDGRRGLTIQQMRKIIEENGGTVEAELDFDAVQAFARKQLSKPRKS